MKLSDPVKKALKETEKADRQETEYYEALGMVVASLRSAEGNRLSRNDVGPRLRIKELRETAEKEGSSDKGLSAQRLLESAAVQFSYYLPNEFLSKKDYQRAIFVLTFATEMKNAPYIWYNLACANSLAGNKKKAVESLAHAVDSGFTDVEQIKNDPDLKSIREEKTYQEIVARASRPPAKLVQ
jgi:tetratricopeptide (TPR) repeat protein